MPTDLQDQLDDMRLRAEAAELERDQLREAIAEAVEHLSGSPGAAIADLVDAVGVVGHLLDGEDVACGNEYGGFAAQVEALVWLAQNTSGDESMRRAMQARLPELLK